MKTVSVSLTIWFVQVLRLCALHEDHTDLLMTQELDVSMATSQQEKLMTKTATITTMRSADQLMSDETPPLTSTLELSGFTSSLEDVRRNTSISTFHHNVTDDSANTSRVTTEHREPGIGTESRRRNIQDVTESSTIRGSIQLEHDIQTTSTSWTEDRSRDTDGANTTTAQVPLIHSTHQSEVTLTGGSSSTAVKSPAPSPSETFLEILSKKQTSPDVSTNTVTPAGTSGHIDITAEPLHSTQASEGSTENIEEPLVSTTKRMDRKTQENTEALTTSPGNVKDNRTNTTWRDGAGFTDTGDTWSTNTTNTSKNISISEIETPHWTNCFSKVSSSHPRRSSNRVCFITLCTLGMTASIFLGLTVFLWVRLSTTRKRERLRGPGQRDRKGPVPAAKETESLWVVPDSSTEERVEFWYANGAMVEEDRRRKRARRAKMRMRGEEDIDMWIQPKVTMKDITEFWYANRSVRQDKETPREL